MKNGHGVYTWADGIRFDGQVRRAGRLGLRASGRWCAGRGAV
jgi:hypothetical protein